MARGLQNSGNMKYLTLGAILRAFLLTGFLLGCTKVQPTEVARLSREESRILMNTLSFGGGVLSKVRQPAAADCASFVDWIPGFKSGFIDAPEDWDHPETSPMIRVFYYWRKGEGVAAARPPVVFFNGGPAKDSHASVNILARQEFAKNAALVFIDQRGTGCSSPFPDEQNEATALRLMNWGSRGIVGDAEAIRKLLFGSQHWRAYGQSFGGLVVHRYLEVAPEGLDRAIAHGVSIMGDPTQWMLERIRSQKRVGEDFLSQFPKDRAILARARAAIPESRCWTQGERSICGPAVLDSLTTLLGFQPNWPALDDRIQQLNGGSGNVNEAALAALVRELVFGASASSGLAGKVISKMEIVPGFDDQANCGEVFKTLKARGDNPDDYAFNECRLLSKLNSPAYALMKSVTGQAISLEKIANSLQKEGAPGFYLFSGEKDVFTPVSTFAEEVRSLGKLVHYKSFPNSGHEGFFTEPEVQDAVTSPNGG